MTAPLGLATRYARMLALRADLDGGTVRFYPGAAPATPDDAANAVALATLTLPNPAGMVSVVGGAVVLSVPTVTGSVTARGTVAWVRFASSTGAGVMDLPASTDALAAPVTISSADVFAGGEITLSCTLTE